MAFAISDIFITAEHRKFEISEYVWFLGAATDVANTRGYTPEGGYGPESLKILAQLNEIQRNVTAGKLVDPAQYPRTYVARKTDPKTNLDVPVWRSVLGYLRSDVVDVMERFDLGDVRFIPICITLPDGSLQHDFRTLAVANLRPTIDETASLPNRQKPYQRSPLISGKKKPADDMFALPSSVNGPALWCDPNVRGTVFVRDDLACALLAEDFGNKLKLRPLLQSDASTAP